MLNKDLTLIEGDFSKKIDDLSNEKIDTMVSYPVLIGTMISINQ